jgi:hypothetical protein
LTCAARTAEGAPDKRTLSRPACQLVADNGKGCPAHWFIR